MAEIRVAGPDDAAELSRFAEKTFRESFAAVNTVEDMSLYCEASYSEEIQRREIVDPAKLTLICEEAGRIIAFAQLAWGEPPDCVVAARPGEINRFYVAQAWHGRGVAGQLMADCVERVGSRGCDVVWLGVWELNPRAIAFYRKSGFVPVGNQVFQLGTDPQRDLVMARPIVTPLVGVSAE